MNVWSKDEMYAIAEADDLHISPFSEDGRTYGTPTRIWSVVVDDVLYVRAYNRKDSRWYRAAMRQKAGRSGEAAMHDRDALQSPDLNIRKVRVSERVMSHSSTYTGARAPLPCSTRWWLEVSYVVFSPNANRAAPDIV